MDPTHDHAQRESQPVPYWSGRANPLVDAIERGIVRVSSDFDAHGVLDLKPLGATMPKQRLPKQPLPFQAQRLEVRLPLGRLDKATATTPPPTRPPPILAPDPAIEVLCAEVAALERANAELARQNASLTTYTELLARITGGFIDLYEHEHR